MERSVSPRTGTAFGEALDEFRARKLGDVELLAGRHPIEDRPGLVDGDEIEINAVDLDLAGVERLHTVIKPARERKLQLGHLLFFPGPLERKDSLSTRARRPKTPLAVSRSGRMTRTAGND